MLRGKTVCIAAAIVTIASALLWSASAQESDSARSENASPRRRTREVFNDEPKLRARRPFLSVDVAPKVGQQTDASSRNASFATPGFPFLGFGYDFSFDK